MSRKFTAVAAASAAVALVLAGCSSADEGKAPSPSSNQSSESAQSTGPLTIESNLGTVHIDRPIKRAASLDNRTFEVLESWGIELVAVPKGLMPRTVTAYSGDDVADIGNHREPNLEALVAAQPDLIISGQRFTQFNGDIAALTDAPIVDFEPREGEDFSSEMIRQVESLGAIFGKEEEAKALVDDYNAAAARVEKAYDGKSTVMAVNVSGGEIGYVAPGTGRTWGPLFGMFNLVPALEIQGGTDSHTGDDISVEAIAQANPDWILVLDRDGAVSANSDGYVPAADVIANNAALQNVKAVTSGQIIYAPADTYTNESIITYTEIYNQMADQFEAAK